VLIEARERQPLFCGTSLAGVASIVTGLEEIYSCLVFTIVNTSVQEVQIFFKFLGVTVTDDWKQ